MRRKYSNIPLVAVGGVLLIALIGGTFASAETRPDSGSPAPAPDFVLGCDDYEIAESVVDDTPGGAQTPMDALEEYLDSSFPGLARDAERGEVEVETIDEYETGAGSAEAADPSAKEADVDTDVGAEHHEVLVLVEPDGSVESQFWAEIVGDSWHVERHALCLSAVAEAR